MSCSQNKNNTSPKTMIIASNDNSCVTVTEAAAAFRTKVQYESMVLLNNKAVECIGCSKLSKAESYFQQSLDKSIKLASAATNTSTVGLIQHATIPFSSSSLTTTPFISSSSSDIDINSSSSSSNNNEVDKNLYVYQRGEYDEGMNRFSEPIAIDCAVSTDNNPASQSQGQGSAKGLHATIATILYNQGLLCLRKGYDERAINFFTRALCLVQESSSSSNDECAEFGVVRMIQILHNIGYVHYRNGRYEDALTSHTQALDVCKSGMSPSTQSMLDLALTLNCLGVVYFHLTGSYNVKSVDLYRQSLAIHQEIMQNNNTYSKMVDDEDAKDNKDVATALNNLGRVYFMNGDHEKALGLHTQALSMRVRLFGNDHLDVAAASFNAGQAHHQLGNLTQSMQHYELYMNIAKKHLGEVHRDIANGYRDMAQIHHDRKDLVQVIRCYRKALSVGQVSLGHCHEENAAILNKLGGVLFESGDLTGAINVYKQGLDIEMELYGMVHPNIVVTLNNMGHIYQLRGDIRSCLRMFNKAATVQRTLLGNFHPNVASTLASVAMVHYQCRNYTKAFHVYQEVLQIQRETHGENHPQVAVTLSSIGHVLFHIEHYELALQTFQESLQILLNSKSSNSNNTNDEDIARVLSNIALLHLKFGDYDQALMHYFEIVRIQGCHENHQTDLVPVLKHIADVYLHRGMFSEGIRYLQEALEIQKKAAIKAAAAAAVAAPATTQQHGEEGRKNYNLAIAQTLNEIANICLQKGETDQMMVCFFEASRYLKLSQRRKSNNNEEMYNLPISDLYFYDIAKMHPECASAA